MEKYLKYGILGMKHGQQYCKYCNEEQVNDTMIACLETNKGRKVLYLYAET
jgi:hypothetical protein